MCVIRFIEQAGMIKHAEWPRLLPAPQAPGGEAGGQHLGQSTSNSVI